MTLDDLLNRTIDLLQHPEFKSFGALQKHRYQMEKRNNEDIELLRDLYKGTISTKEQIEKARKSRAKHEKSHSRLDKYHKKLTSIKKKNSYNKFLLKKVINSDQL